MSQSRPYPPRTVPPPAGWRGSHCAPGFRLPIAAIVLVAAVVALFSSPLAPALAAAPSVEALARGFLNPPASARPWVYYFIMDGNLAREGVTADFEALKRAGIGGMIIMEVDVGIPRGPVKFMSPEWRQIFKHAVAEAERLGLQITLNAGPGWTGSGGPWVKPEQSMQHLVASAVEIAGPAHFSATLPRPAPRAPYFGNAGLPPEIVKAKDEFYVDVAVLAVPKTSEAARIADIDEKALYLRHPYTSRPGTKPFIASSASYPVLPPDAAIAPGRIVDLTAKLDADGHLTWDAPAGQWTILRFGRTSTGANTRPAPAPGLGLECDKFDPAALEAHFDAFIGALLREIGPRQQSADAGWNMLHIDSWEMGSQNWTAAFRAEFLRRRGYDPLRYLPAVTGRVVESLEVSERFLWDLRQTAQELVIENHAQHLRELGHRHGFGLSIEPYDMNPCADLSLGAVADVPMGEFWLYGFNSFFSVIEAASIAHTCGRPIVAAESFTSTDAERWQAHPASMKTLGDWAFSAGVNRIVFHRSQHQPQLDRRPGMTMGPYGVHWERTQTWWDLVPAYHAYLARCQFLLRQGLPVADVCYLAPEGAPQVFRPPASATRGHPPDRRGYNFDGIAPETLFARMSVRNGMLGLPDGMSYRVLVLPERDTMTPALLRKVKTLVEAGATVVGPRPLKSPSLSRYPNCDEDVKQLAGELWGDCDGMAVKEHKLGKGRVVWDRGAKATGAPETKSPLESATWIWHNEGNPAVSAPVGKRFFRRVVTLEANAGIESALVSMTADNSFDLFVNGRHAGNGDNFHETCSFDVAPMLQPGTNVLAVEAENGGDAPNPAGLIGRLIVSFRDGHRLDVPTDRTWQSSREAVPDWLTRTTNAEGWGAALELGPFGMSPWGRSEETIPEPDQYGDFAIVAGLLEKAGVPADFESDGPIRYTHRRAGDTDIYFVANREERAVNANCSFRVNGKTPELWDPLTGERRALPEFTAKARRTTVPIRFEPAQSFFVVFNQRAMTSRKNSRNFAELKPVAGLDGPWEVAFDPRWGGPEKVTFASLEDWTKRPEEGIKFYSGMATYRKTFDAPAGPVGRRCYLELGVVKNLARVRLNGRDLGILWCAPWRVEIARALKPTRNRLEITVANLWPNRLIGDQLLPPERRLTSTTWNPFTKDSPLLESGLRGPVTIEEEIRER
ncbi:MAG: glycosyl hydrolase [Verrucomicrobiota bacterium]